VDTAGNVFLADPHGGASGGGALAACRKQDKHSKARRESCERAAHRRYGPAHPVKKTKKGSKR
jgi:hypothetical protein